MLAVSIVWFVLWCLAPGLSSLHPMKHFVSEINRQLLGESGVTLLAIVITLIITRKQIPDLLGFDRLGLRLYLIPIVLAILVPLHYHGDLNPFVYVAWMTISVFWQQYLTFGLLQARLTQLIPTRWAITLTVILFYLGHAILIPHRFAPNSFGGVGGAAFVITVGVAFALLRHATKSIRINLVAHWSSYFILC